MAGNDPVKFCAVCGARLGPVNQTSYCHECQLRGSRTAVSRPIDDRDDMAVNFRRRIAAVHGVEAETASTNELWKVLGDHAGGLHKGCDACARSRIGRTDTRSFVSTTAQKKKKVPDDAC